MFKQTNKNSFFGYFLYDQIVPKDHFLRKLAAAVDFNFVNELCQDAYPNFGKAGSGALLRPGMTIAIEPMLTIGDPAIRFLDDGWTVVTAQGGLSAHYEHTVLITDGDPELLTR